MCRLCRRLLLVMKPSQLAPSIALKHVPFLFRKTPSAFRCLWPQRTPRRHLIGCSRVARRQRESVRLRERRDRLPCGIVERRDRERRAPRDGHDNFARLEWSRCSCADAFARCLLEFERVVPANTGGFGPREKNW